MVRLNAPVILIMQEIWKVKRQQHKKSWGYLGTMNLGSR